MSQGSQSSAAQQAPSVVLGSTVLDNEKLIIEIDSVAYPVDDGLLLRSQELLPVAHEMLSVVDQFPYGLALLYNHPAFQPHFTGVSKEKLLEYINLLMDHTARWENGKPSNLDKWGFCDGSSDPLIEHQARCLDALFPTLDSWIPVITLAAETTERHCERPEQIQGAVSILFQFYFFHVRRGYVSRATMPNSGVQGSSVGQIQWSKFSSWINKNYDNGKLKPLFCQRLERLPHLNTLRACLYAGHCAGLAQQSVNDSMVAAVVEKATENCTATLDILDSAFTVPLENVPAKLKLATKELRPVARLIAMTQAYNCSGAVGDRKPDHGIEGIAKSFAVIESKIENVINRLR